MAQMAQMAQNRRIGKSANLQICKSANLQISNPANQRLDACIGLQYDVFDIFVTGGEKSSASILI